MRNLYAVPDAPRDTLIRCQLDPRTPEGKAAMKLLDVPTAILVEALGLPPRNERPHEVYAKSALCAMAVKAGITPLMFRELIAKATVKHSSL